MLIFLFNLSFVGVWKELKGRSFVWDTFDFCSIQFFTFCLCHQKNLKTSFIIFTNKPVDVKIMLEVLIKCMLLDKT